MLISRVYKTINAFWSYKTSSTNLIEVSLFLFQIVGQKESGLVADGVMGGTPKCSGCLLVCVFCLCNKVCHFPFWELILCWQLQPPVFLGMVWAALHSWICGYSAILLCSIQLSLNPDHSPCPSCSNTPQPSPTSMILPPQCFIVEMASPLRMLQLRSCLSGGWPFESFFHRECLELS